MAWWQHFIAIWILVLMRGLLWASVAFPRMISRRRFERINSVCSPLAQNSSEASAMSSTCEAVGWHSRGFGHHDSIAIAKTAALNRCACRGETLHDQLLSALVTGV